MPVKLYPVFASRVITAVYSVPVPNVAPLNEVTVPSLSFSKEYGPTIPKAPTPHQNVTLGECNGIYAVP
jgi:hypothetical protein